MCTRGHIFYGDEICWSWFWIPKDGECFFLYNVFIIVDFPVDKDELIYWKEKKIHQMFFPMLFERIWMLSSLCCRITIFALHMYASSVGTSACTKNANISAFLFNHTTLDGRFDLLDHCQHPSRDHVVFWVFSLSLIFSTSILQDHHVLLCLCGPYVATHWPPHFSCQCQAVCVPSYGQTQKL